MRQGGEPQGVQVVRQGEPTPYHCDFNPLYFGTWNAWAASAHPTNIPIFYQILEICWLNYQIQIANIK